MSYLASLDAQRTYQQTRIALVQAQAARFTDTAALFQALGGGWWNAPDAVASAASAPAADALTTTTSCVAPIEPANATNIEHEIWSENMTKRMLIMIGGVLVLVAAPGLRLLSCTSRS